MTRGRGAPLEGRVRILGNGAFHPRSGTASAFRIAYPQCFAFTRRVILAFALCAVAAPLRAEVARLEIQRRVTLDVTPRYELLVGRVSFAIDPSNAHNAIIADVDHAPRNALGRVEFSADVAVLRPLDPAVANGALIVDVVNRGRMTALQAFNRAANSGTPAAAAELGDMFLMSRGFTIAWIGWQADLVGTGDQLMRLHAPVATSGGAPMVGWVRVQRAPLANVETLALADDRHIPYAVVDPDSSQHVLTLREAEGPVQVVPRDSWRFVRDGSAQPVGIALEGGFRAGRLYELVYRATGPFVSGLGLAAIRDTATFFKNDRRAPFRVERTIAFGVSQSGRLLRTFLYDGFNADEAGRQVFDGFFIHAAGSSRGSFNRRFAQPSASDATATLFPFADTPQVDPQTRRSDALLTRLDAQRPRIFYTNSSAEYWWLRRAALQHTTIEGLLDLPLPANVRLYFLAGTQHVPSPFPPATDAAARAASNPNDYRWTLRALLVALDAWTKDETKRPPPSVYPRIDDGTLVPLTQVALPAIPGMLRPRTLVERTVRYDFGPELRRGLVDYEPPHEGGPLPLLLPQVDTDGNERAGIRLPDVAVPLATYTGWNPRRSDSGGAWLVGLTGSFFPFARTREERERVRDPRPSIEERYANSSAYLSKYRDALIALIDKRYLLEDDVTAMMTEAAGKWLYLTKH